MPGAGSIGLALMYPSWEDNFKGTHFTMFDSKLVMNEIETKKAEYEKFNALKETYDRERIAYN